MSDIDQTADLDCNSQACLAAVRDVLGKYGCLDVFGVNLLHKHFEMDDNEILIESVDEGQRHLSIRPMSAELAGQLPRRETQWAWRRNPDGEVTMLCIGQCIMTTAGHRKVHY